MKYITLNYHMYLIFNITTQKVGLSFFLDLQYIYSIILLEPDEPNLSPAVISSQAL